MEVRHECWCNELTEKFKDTTLIGIPTHAEQPDSIAHTFIVKTPQVKEVLDFIKKHPMTTIIKVIKWTKDSMIVYVEQPKASLFVNAATRHGAVLTEPTLTVDGTDKVSLFFGNEKNVKNMFSELSDDYDIKLKSKKVIPIDKLSFDTFHTSGFFKLQTAAQLLSERQKEVFALACRRGYFKIPKEVTIEELAEEIGLDSRTVADHLRKAQNKLSPIISDVLRLF
ncbi:HTH DNA binding domain protein [uncultured archaeon]|nr:HTH DNA binding domain protein [uncultured archaeon]